MRWSEPGWRSTVLGVAVSAVLGALFPRFWRSTRWPVGLGRRGAAAYVAVNTLVIFAAHGLGRRMREEHDTAVAEARARLGRDPTDRELHEQYGRRRLRRHLGREPTDEELERALRPGAG